MGGGGGGHPPPLERRQADAGSERLAAFDRDPRIGATEKFLYGGGRRGGHPPPRAEVRGGAGSDSRRPPIARSRWGWRSEQANAAKSFVGWGAEGGATPPKLSRDKQISPRNARDTGDSRPPLASSSRNAGRSGLKQADLGRGGPKIRSNSPLGHFYFAGSKIGWLVAQICSPPQAEIFVGVKKVLGRELGPTLACS